MPPVKEESLKPELGDYLFPGTAVRIAMTWTGNKCWLMNCKTTARTSGWSAGKEMGGNMVNDSL
jgi:hypothetical protein